MRIQLGKKRRRPLRNTMVVLTIIVLMPIAFVYLINHDWVLKNTLRTFNFSSETKIALSNFHWNPLTSEIRLTGLGIHHEPNGRDGWVDEIRLSYRPLGFLRGKFIIDELDIKGVNILLPPKGEEEKKQKAPKSLNIGKLLLLHSLIIEQATMSNFSVAFAKDSTFRADEINWSLKPRFTGDTTLEVEGKGINVHKGTKLLLVVDGIGMKTSTRLARWEVNFPYFNAMEGEVSATALKFQDLPLDSLNADMTYESGRIDLKDLGIVIGGNKLTGVLMADILDGQFRVSVDIPKPIHLPYLGKPTKTIDTAGKLSGHIEMSGTGFTSKDISAKGHVALTHQFDGSPDYPAQVTSDFSWHNGVIALNGTQVTAGASTLGVDGAVDIVRKQMKFSAEGQKFPLEAIFENFTNPHLKKIYGATDVKGTFEGWGKQFTAHVTGTTFDGGFKPMVGERIETEFEATYNKLAFAWKLFQGSRQTGTADLIINMGQKIGDAPRSKSVDLIAKLGGHELEPTFPGFNLTGIADGEITLKGPQQTFTGAAKATVTNGSWLHVPIDSARTDIAITRRSITFDKAVIKPKTLREIPFTSPLVMDLTDGRFRLHGEPVAGLGLDLIYTYDAKRAQITELSYSPAERPGERVAARGTVISGGAINLAVDGKFDLSLLDPLSALIREGSGPMTVNLRVGGSTSSPTLNGTIELSGNALSPRPVRLALEDLSGTIKFEGHRIHFDGVRGMVEDGEFTLGGWLEHQDFKLARADLTLNGKEFNFRTANNAFRMEFDGSITLTGAFPHPLLAGNVNILDGRYTKDFVLLEKIGGSRPSADGEEESVITFDPRLDLRVHNSGDLRIKNNVGDIDLKADVTIRGTRTKPQLDGAVAVREGRINYLGLNFDITRGFVELRGPYAKPYIEIEAQRELRLYNINLRLYGFTDNLALDLEGSSYGGPLEKRDVISLLAFGVTEQERREVEDTRSGRDMGISVAAQQVGQMLERPITEATHLDIFRIEAAEEDTDYDQPGKVATRLRIGKQLTDRLSIDFSTDIDTKDAEQTVTSEYLITDTILIKGSRSSDAKYEGSVGLRFRLR